MRVLFVMTGADVGGAERFVAMMGRNWPPHDSIALVVLLSRGTLSDELEDAFGKVVYLNVAPHDRRMDRIVKHLEAVIGDFAPDVIWSHMFHSDLVVALARTSASKVTTVHTQGFGSGVPLLTKLVARGVGLLSYRYDAVVPASDSSEMDRFLHTLRMRSVGQPIANATEVPATPSFSIHSRSLVAIGRNHPVKGQTILLRAFNQVAARHPHWRLRLIGPRVTASQPPFIDLLKDTGLRYLYEQHRISLEGATRYPDAALNDAGALVIASVYGEAMPMVGLEAAARGIPVITTAVGSCPAFVDDRRFLARPNDADSLARALEAYMSLDDGERSLLSALARERAVRLYAPEIAVNRYRALFRDAVANRGK